MRPIFGVFAAISMAPAALVAQAASGADTTSKVTWSAFVDGYYAWDFQQPKNLDRSFAGGALFTTQPSRHNEFNVNLAFVEAKLSAPKVRGRIALQAGTSVQSNYFGEPANGQVSGASLSRFIQEAVVGVKVANNLWIDGGVFFSHMGMEGWLSRDNPTYTRSLVAEYSPYYQSGVKATWQPTASLTAQLDVVNGWQNISENNTGKGAGIRVDYALHTSSVVSYYNFFSSEAGSKLRTFNGLGAKHTVGRISLLGEFDVGSQSNSGTGDGGAMWYGFTAVTRARVTETVFVSARLERFDDKHQIVLGTGSLNEVANAPFRGNGASIGVDWSPESRVLWRTELRGFQNNAAVFSRPASGALSRRDAFAVSSLAITF